VNVEPVWTREKKNVSVLEPILRLRNVQL
jgi:hypothetical protein